MGGLHHRGPAPLLHGPEACGAIIEPARQEDGHHARVIHHSRRAEQQVNSRPKAISRGTAGHPKVSGRDDEMVIRWGHIYVAG